MLTSTPRAPARLTSSSSGLRTAACAAERARSGPLAEAEPIIAMPTSPITVRTSAKSTFTRPGLLITSAMPDTAPCSTSLAAAYASSTETSSPSTAISLSFGMMISESTRFASSSIPACATLWRLPSNVKGRVTTATVRMPSCFAMSAMIGAAPVPVPPPMPAVMNSMSEPAISSPMRSRSSIAASRPISGFAPAPRPRVSAVPSWSCVRAFERLSACASVLAQMKSTPESPLMIMCSTALPPQPPTPMTLMIAPSCEAWSMISNMGLPFLSCLQALPVGVVALLSVGLRRPGAGGRCCAAMRCVSIVPSCSCRRGSPVRPRSPRNLIRAKRAPHRRPPQKFALNHCLIRSATPVIPLTCARAASARIRWSRPCISRPTAVE